MNFDKSAIKIIMGLGVAGLIAWSPISLGVSEQVKSDYKTIKAYNQAKKDKVKKVAATKGKVAAKKAEVKLQNKENRQEKRAQNKEKIKGKIQPKQQTKANAKNDLKMKFNSKR